MHILGVTGGVATGKSTVTRMLADLGAPTVSADALARDLLAPGAAATRAVLAAFPACADLADPAGQTVDRRALGRLVFDDPSARARLEALTHPAIIAALAEQVAAWRPSSEAPAAAAEIPLLFEAGLTALVGTVVVVACAEAAQVARLRARLGADEAEARRLIQAQWPLSEKIARADVVITTDGDLADTRRQVGALWETL
jgi:dephospho-CoA kinase